MCASDADTYFFCESRVVKDWLPEGSLSRSAGVAQSGMLLARESGTRSYDPDALTSPTAISPDAPARGRGRHAETPGPALMETF